MPTTLTHLIRPDRGDKGDPVFTALETNINRLDVHEHTGTTGQGVKIDSYILQRDNVVNVDATGWVAEGDLFKKAVNFPAGFTAGNNSEFGNAVIQFFFDGGNFDGEQCSPKTVRLSDTSFEIHSPFNNQAFNVSFL